MPAKETPSKRRRAVARGPGVLDAIYAAAAVPERWPDSLGIVADYIGASGGLGAVHRPFNVTGRLRDDLGQLYLQRYTANPIAIALQNVPCSQPLLTSTLVDMTVLRRSAFHADILAPQKIDGMVAFTHSSLCWPGGSGGVSFTLTSKQSDDASFVLRRMRSIAGHLTRAIDVSLDLGRRLGERSALIPVLDVVPTAAMLLDRRGAVSYANKPAAALIAEDDGLSVRRAESMRLVADDTRDNRSLSRAIGTATAVAMGCDVGDWVGTVRVARKSGRTPLVLTATPLPAPFHPFGPAIPTQACVLVQVIGSNARSDHQVRMLRRVFHLTEAEARVATLIGGGLSAPAVAGHLRVSLTTVKTHLHHCFDKIEVRSQVELARLLATVPAERPSLGQTDLWPSP